ncbi:hypothetical protein CNR22_18850 [Sphingobacteriaceae bacterium]|nr:hypothetical protein CNR22_18850 [Sphingobacteriaceae bacterium]
MTIKDYNTGVKILAQATITIYTITYRDDGILNGHVSKGGKWKPEDYEILFPAIGEMVNYKKVPLLATYDKGVFPTAESTAYWADPKTTCPYFSCEALIMDSLPLKILGNFYVEYKKPARPTKIFDNHEKAVEWLKSFL